MPGKPKQTNEEILERVNAINPSTPRSEVENVCLAICNRLESHDAPPDGYSWFHVLTIVLRNWK
jgi:hypothetical protein